MVLADGAGTPLGLHLEAASPSEVKRVEATLASGNVRTGQWQRGQLTRRMGDRGYDSNTVGILLMQRGIKPVIPECSNNHVTTPQDGRKMRRDKRRWIIERGNSWLQAFRRLVVRYERLEKIFAALVHMACALITLKRIWG
jgi:transposase